MESLEALIGRPDYALLLFLRVSGLLISSPIFGRRNVPRLSKIGLCGALSLVFIAVLPAPADFPEFKGVFDYTLAALGELAFGAAMGFAATAVFDVVLGAGAIIDMQTGFSMVSIYDPQSNAQAPISGSLLNILLLVVFFGMDGHLRLIDMLFSTLQAVPVGRASLSPDIAWAAAEVMSSTLTLTVTMAMPVLAAGLLLEAALGVVIRTVPQMNMFVVGIPLKIVIGLLVILGSLAVFTDFSGTLAEKVFELTGKMFAYIRSVT